MKITMTFLSKFLYAAISISVVFGLAVLGAGDGTMAASQSLAVRSGFSGAMDHAGQGHQYDSQKQNRHSQINNTKFAHNILPDNQMADSQEVIAVPDPNISIVGELLSITAGKMTDPNAIKPIPTQMSTAVWNWFGVRSGRLGTNTNNSSDIGRNSNTVDNRLSMLAPQVFAAEAAIVK